MNNTITFGVFKKQPVCFKQWGGKNYSLFLVLGKVVIIAILAVIYHKPVEASDDFLVQDTTEPMIEVRLEEIEVNAQRAPVTRSEAARIVTVIEKKEIEAIPVQSIQELLEYIPGVDIRQRGGQGVQADISIRGSSFDQSIILLNGINITDPQTGHHNLNLPVSLQQIERIEVLKGPSSRIFGPNAFSGAINIITKDAAKDQITIGASYGSFNYLNADISGTQNSEKFSQFLGFNSKSSDGYIENTDFYSRNLYYKLQAGNLKNIQFQLGFTDKGFGANSFYSPKYPEQYEETKTYFTSLKWQTNTRWHLAPSVYWRRHFDRFELFRYELPEWYQSHNYHLTDAAGAGLNAWFSSAYGKTAFGAEYRYEHIFSNVLGDLLDEPVEIEGTETQYIYGKTRNVYSMFFEHTFYTGKWIFSAGFMSNLVDELKTGINFFPGLDVSFQANESIKIYGTSNRSLRMPTFTDLYYNGPTNTGNPDLKPETSVSAESGFKINAKHLKGHLSFFYRKGENIIDWVRLPEEEIWHTDNLTTLSNTGIELSFEYIPPVRKDADFRITRIGLGYLYNSSRKYQSQYISKYALDNLNHKLNIILSHTISEKISSSWDLLFQDRNGTYTEFSNGDFGEEVNYKPFLLVNGKINYKTNLFDIFVSASNLLNNRYFDFGNITQPGRWIKAGINIQVDM